MKPPAFWTRDGGLALMLAPLGRLGFLIARETHWPEVGRALAMKGAEVFLNTMGSRITVDPATGAHLVRQMRAYENIAYLAAANYGPFIGVAGM